MFIILKAIENTVCARTVCLFFITIVRATTIVFLVLTILSCFSISVVPLISVQEALISVNHKLIIYVQDLGVQIMYPAPIPSFIESVLPHPYQVIRTSI